MIGATVTTLALVLGLASAPPDKKPPARTYVFTEQAGGTVSADEAGRLDSLRDLQDLVGRRKSDFTLVSSAEQAEVIVEVVNREEMDTAQGGFGGASMSRFRQTIVRLRVKSGDKLSDLKGMGQGSWKAAAKDVVERLAKWVKNR